MTKTLNVTFEVTALVSPEEFAKWMGYPDGSPENELRFDEWDQEEFQECITTFGDWNRFFKITGRTVRKVEESDRPFDDEFGLCGDEDVAGDSLDDHSNIDIFVSTGGRGAGGVRGGCGRFRLGGSLLQQHHFPDPIQLRDRLGDDAGERAAGIELHPSHRTHRITARKPSAQAGGHQ